MEEPHSTLPPSQLPPSQLQTQPFQNSQVWGELRSFFQTCERFDGGGGRGRGRRSRMLQAQRRKLWSILDIADRRYLKDALIPYVQENLARCHWSITYTENLSDLDPEDPRGLLIQDLCPLGECNPHYLEELATKKYLCNIERIALFSTLRIPRSVELNWGERRAGGELRLFTIEGTCRKTLPEVSLEPLAQNPNLSNLSDLTIDLCDIGDKGLDALSMSPYLKNLTTLSLRGNQVTEIGLRNFARTAQMPALRYLNVGLVLGLGREWGLPQITLAQLRELGLSALEDLRI